MVNLINKIVVRLGELFFYAKLCYLVYDVFWRIKSMKKKITKIISIILLLISVFTIAGCTKKQVKTRQKQITIVTSTNIYANIAKQVAGKYAKVTPLIANGNTDPHDFEPTVETARVVANSDILVANGLGYDDWIDRLADANNKKVLKVGNDLMGLKTGANPHIWYDLQMPKKYVNYLVNKLDKLDPKHKKQFNQNGNNYLKRIDKLEQLEKSLDYKHAKPVFVSEPVFDYMLNSTGYIIDDKAFEDAVENETDPSAQIIQEMNQKISNHKIAFFVNNTQASSSTVNSFVKLAQEHNIPILNVRETMPNNTTYIRWMNENLENLGKVSKINAPE